MTTDAQAKSKGQSSKKQATAGYIVHGADHATGDECMVYFESKKGAKTFQSKYYPDAKVQKASKKQMKRIDSQQVADCTVVENSGRVDVSAATPQQVDTLIALGYRGDPTEGGEYLYPPSQQLPNTSDPYKGHHCADVIADPTDGNCAAYEQAVGHP